MIHNLNHNENFAEVIKREISFGFEKLTLQPDNESAWNYIRGYFNKHSEEHDFIGSFIIEKCGLYIDLEGEEGRKNPFALSLVAKIS